MDENNYFGNIHDLNSISLLSKSINKNNSSLNHSTPKIGAKKNFIRGGGIQRKCSNDKTNLNRRFQSGYVVKEKYEQNISKK